MALLKILNEKRCKMVCNHVRFEWNAFLHLMSSMVELTVGQNGITILFAQIKTLVFFNVATCFDIIKVEICTYVNPSKTKSVRFI